MVGFLVQAGLVKLLDGFEDVITAERQVARSGESPVEIVPASWPSLGWSGRLWPAPVLGRTPVLALVAARSGAVVSIAGFRPVSIRVRWALILAEGGEIK
jgi:hypothetical protein